jgi:S1-C subfamily serine protease
MTAKGRASARLAIALSSAVLAAPLAAQGGSSFYELVSESIVLIQYSIYLSPGEASDPSLFGRLETLEDKKLLGQLMPISSGSGFFVDGEGDILTNRHVVEPEDLDKVRRDLGDAMAYSIESKHAKYFSRDELRTLKTDLYKMITKGKLSFSVFAGSRVFENPKKTVVAGPRELDLALLTVEGLESRGLRLASAGELGKSIVGEDAFSFGYPLGMKTADTFKEMAVTMNKGIVSAVRDAELGIQHTAAISPGNSGGPLVDSSGVVIGINTALIAEGNSLYYSIPSDRALAFLKSKGREAVAERNSSIAAPTRGTSSAATGPKVNTLGEIEVSSDVLIDAKEDSEVFIGDIRVGRAPLMIALKKPLTEIRVVSPTAEFAGKLRLLTSLAGTTAIVPRMTPRIAKIILDTDPPGATAYYDGNVAGKTPCSAELPAGEHTFRFSLEGYYFSPVKTIVLAEGGATLAATGSLTRPLRIDGLTAGKAVGFRLSRGEEALYFDSGSPIELPAGDWTLLVDGDAGFAGIKIPVSMDDAAATVDVSGYRRFGRIDIPGIKATTRVWVDGLEWAEPASRPLILPFGVHDIMAWEDGSQPLERRGFNLETDGPITVTWFRQEGYDARAARLARTGGIIAAAGAMLMFVGGYMVDNEPSDTYSPYYGASDTKIYAGGIVQVFGFIGLLASGVYEIKAFVSLGDFKKQKGAFLGKFAD